MQSQTKKIYVYRLSSEAMVNEFYTEKVEVLKWTPGITQFIPPNSPFYYFVFWLAHYLGLFESRDYCAFALYQNGEPVCSLVCVPAFYRWTFMKHGDLQIKNVYTNSEHRKQGLASTLIKRVIQRMKKMDRSFWYMTHEYNIPSQKLCKKIGFIYLGEYKRSKNNFFVYKGQLVKVTVDKNKKE